MAPDISVWPYALTMSAPGNVRAISSSVERVAGEAPHIATRRRSTVHARDGGATAYVVPLGGDEDAHGHGVLPDQPDRSVRIEPGRRQQDAGGAQREKGQHAVDSADVEQRLPRKPHVVRARAHLVDPAQRRRHEVGMAEDRALRPPGGARRVAEQRGVVFADIGLLRRLGTGDRRLVLRPDLELDPAAGEAVRPAAGDQGDRAGVLEDVGDLVRHQAEIDGDGARPDPVARQQRLCELEPVVQQQCDAVARPDAVGGERRGEARGARVQLVVRARGACEHHRRPTAMRAAPTGQQLGQDEAAGACERSCQVLRTVHALTPGAP